MKSITYTAVAAIAAVSFTGLGCDKDTSTLSTAGTRTNTTTAPGVEVTVKSDDGRTAADRAADSMRSGANKVGDAVATAADKTRDVAHDVGGKINDAAHRTGDAASRSVDDARQAGARGTAAAPDAEDVRDVLAQVTQAALTKGGLDDMVERFVDADRNRIGPGANANFADLDGRVDQFLKDWKAKYNQDFNIKNEEAAFPGTQFMIAQGEIAKGAAGASVDVNKTPNGGVDVDVNNRTGVDSPSSPAADTNRNDAGRNVATVQVAASGKMEAMTVPMIHEAPDRWKIDAPDSLTAEKLKQNILDHLTAADNPAQWPSDVNQAYAQVSRHVLMAILDKPAK